MFAAGLVWRRGANFRNLVPARIRHMAVKFETATYLLSIIA
jgi:hypothetical protein